MDVIIDFLILIYILNGVFLIITVFVMWLSNRHESYNREKFKVYNVALATIASCIPVAFVLFFIFSYVEILAICKRINWDDEYPRFVKFFNRSL